MTSARGSSDRASLQNALGAGLLNDRDQNRQCREEQAEPELPSTRRAPDRRRRHRAAAPTSAHGPTSSTMRNGVRRSGRGSSLYPSILSLTCASASLRPWIEIDRGVSSVIRAGSHDWLRQVTPPLMATRIGVVRAKANTANTGPPRPSAAVIFTFCHIASCRRAMTRRLRPAPGCRLPKQLPTSH